MGRYLIIAGRIVGVLTAVFIASFAFDVFAMNASLVQMLVGFAIHALPVLLLLVILALSWRWPLVSGLLFLAAALAPFFYLSNAPWVNALLAAPVALTGLLLSIGAVLARRR